MELSKFFALLKRHRLTLIIVPVVTIIITFFLVRNLPDTYTSQAQVATGIVDETQLQPFSDGSSTQESKINQQFSNIIEMIRMKKMVDQVSYLLILHDLTEEQPFRKFSPLMKDLSPEAKKHAVKVFKEKYAKKEGLNLWDNDQKGLYSLLRSMKYDEESISKKLNIYRAGSSDFIFVEFSSDNPELSAFVVNHLSGEFITYYNLITKENQHKAVNFLSRLLEEKQEAMNLKIEELRTYKINNRVLNLNEQSRQLYGLILDYESRKMQAEKDISATTGALKSIDSKFNPNDRRYIESALTKINQEILSTKERLRSLNDQYIQSGFSRRHQISIDSLQDILAAQIQQSSDKYIYNPLTAKQDLVQQKIALEVQLDLAKNSVSLLQRELRNLTGQFDKLVPHEAVVQSLERDIEVASQEYLTILNKYNQSSMESGFSTKIRQVQPGMPGMAQPSKKMLLVILSGIISFVFCLAVLFILFFFDNSITYPKELAQKTDLPVLGTINAFQGVKFDLKDLWKNQNKSEPVLELKNQLRSLRYELNQELNNDLKVLSISSIKEGQGKTFLAINLAYAFSITGKRVLLIDGNFKDPAVSSIVKPGYYIEELFKSNTTEFDFFKGDLITVLGNHGEDVSLFEINDEAAIKRKIDLLKMKFDRIIIETPAMESINKAKEWLSFTDKLIAVMEADQAIQDEDYRKIDYLKSLNGKFIGWILNKIKG